MKNSNEVEKNKAYYLGLPYGIALRRDDEGDWVARVEELQGCTAHGATQSEALSRLEDVKAAWIEDAIETGGPVPEPSLDKRLPSGKWLQRVPRSLHKGLTETAEKEGVSLNQLVTTILAEALGRRKGQPVVAIQEPPEEKGWYGVLEAGWRQHQKGWDPGSWQLDPHKQILLVFDALASPVFAIPNQINENHFRVTERASKKELTFKS